jgi:hypothetical protein
VPRDDKLWKANERLNNKLYNGITNEQKIFQAQFLFMACHSDTSTSLSTRCRGISGCSISG